jgi:hypothetical protein
MYGKMLMILCISDNYTEELLALHEKEVASVKEYYENHKQILELVGKREVLFHKMIEFEASIVCVGIMFF